MWRISVNKAIVTDSCKHYTYSQGLTRSFLRTESCLIVDHKSCLSTQRNWKWEVRMWKNTNSSFPPFFRKKTSNGASVKMEVAACSVNVTCLSWSQFVVVRLMSFSASCSFVNFENFHATRPLDSAWTQVRFVSSQRWQWISVCRPSYHVSSKILAHQATFSVQQGLKWSHWTKL